MEETAPAAPVEDTAPSPVRSKSLTVGEQARVKAMQRLASAPDRATYLTRQTEIAQQLSSLKLIFHSSQIIFPIYSAKTVAVHRFEPRVVQIETGDSRVSN